jgi:hypothetical protein
MGQFYFRKLRYFPFGIVPLMLHIHISFIHHQNHTILANASVIQKSLRTENETASMVSKHYSYSVMKHILMKIFHYSRWHSTLYIFIFLCASQTNWQTETGIRLWNPLADPQNQAKYRAHVRSSGRYENCRHLERKITWSGKILLTLRTKCTSSMTVNFTRLQKPYRTKRQPSMMIGVHVMTQIKIKLAK